MDNRLKKKQKVYISEGIDDLQKFNWQIVFQWVYTFVFIKKLKKKLAVVVILDFQYCFYKLKFVSFTQHGAVFECKYL